MITFGVESDNYGGDYELLATDLNDEFDTTIGTRLDSAVAFGPVVLRVGQDGGENLVVSGTGSGTGNQTQVSEPPNVAALIHKRTARGGRRGRGRMYLPWCLADADVDEAGVVLGATQVLLQTQCTNFLGHLTAGTGAMTFAAAMVLLHSPSGDDVSSPTTPGDPNTVTTLTVDSLVATQRRRLNR